MNQTKNQLQLMCFKQQKSDTIASINHQILMIIMKIIKIALIKIHQIYF